MTGTEKTLQFGHAEPLRTYAHRPGAYGIVLDSENRVLVVEVQDLCVLPDGGITEGESAETALIREFLEETGYPVNVGRYLGQARQYVRAISDGGYYNKLCLFFLVAVNGSQRARTESDHWPRWKPLPEARHSLSEGAQRWALLQLENRR